MMQNTTFEDHHALAEVEKSSRQVYELGLLGLPNWKAVQALKHQEG
jgi:hypothetical protein